VKQAFGYPKKDKQCPNGTRNAATLRALPLQQKSTVASSARIGNSRRRATDPHLMGLVMTKIKLTNSFDFINASDGRIDPATVRCVEIDALADTGAIELCIPEEIAEKLGARIVRKRSVVVADGRRLEVTEVGPLEIEILGRSTTGNAMVLPRGTRPLLGALQLEQLDLVVVPRTGEVIGNPEHPDGPLIPILLAS
jgi:clan AA aspartic protease